MILVCNKDWKGRPLTILKHEDTLFYQKENALPMNRTMCQTALRSIKHNLTIYVQNLIDKFHVCVNRQNVYIPVGTNLSPIILSFFHRSHCACPSYVDFDLDICEHSDQLFSEGRCSEDVKDEVTTVV